MALEPMVAFAPISGSVVIGLHHRNSEKQRISNTTPFNNGIIFLPGRDLFLTGGLGCVGNCPILTGYESRTT